MHREAQAAGADVRPSASRSATSRANRCGSTPESPHVVGGYGSPRRGGYSAITLISRQGSARPVVISSERRERSGAPGTQTLLDKEEQSMRLTDFFYPARAFAFMAKLCAGLLIFFMIGSLAIQTLANARLTLGDLAGFLASWLILSLVAYAVRERRLAHRHRARAQGAARAIERERHMEEEA